MEPCPICRAAPCACSFSAEELAEAARALTAGELAELDRVRKQRCQTCRGARWLCEDHPAEPWPHDGCGGAGAPCLCNPAGAVEWRAVLAELPPDGPLQ